MAPMTRRAIPDDAEAVARLHGEVRAACLPYLPDLHDAAETLRYFRERVFPASEVCVAGTGAPVGFCAFRSGWVDHLYIRPDCHRQGIGTALLGRAMAANARLRLWTFQRNAPAIAFYCAHGFRTVRETDGSRNEERQPDVLLEWTA
jgi:ribosomal protein S18 acetylase RimI-like enzyme